MPFRSHVQTAAWVAALAFAAGCSGGPVKAEPGKPRDEHMDVSVLRTPFYRVFRGVKKSDLPYAAFRKKLQETFIPSLPRTHGKNGLLAYLPALTPKPRARSIAADELAIVAYESEETYRAARETPEGRSYAELHWEIFDRNKTKSLSAESFDGTIQLDVAYDVLGNPVDWQKGESWVRMAVRKPGATVSKFLAELSEKVREERERLAAEGLNAYIVVADGEYAVTYLNFDGSSRPPELAGASFSAAHSTKADRWSGAISPGQLVNVMFEPR